MKKRNIQVDGNRVKYLFEDGEWIEIDFHRKGKNDLIIYASRGLTVYPQATNSVVLRQESPFDR